MSGRVITRVVPPSRPALMMGPPASAALPLVRQRLADACRTCDCCGQPWHFVSGIRGPYPMQVHAGGRVMPVRRAAWMAYHPQRRLIKGWRITSRCDNPCCINPDLLVQVRPGEVLARHYETGVRSRAAAAALLIACRRAAQKITEADAAAIRNDHRKGTEAAHEWGITPEYYNAIQRGSARCSRAENPFAGLISGGAA